MTVLPPLLRRRRVLAAAVETTVGTAAALTGTNAVFNAFDVEINPTIDFMEREGQGGFSPLFGTLGAQGGTCKFKTELLGGTSTEPQSFSTLMPGCGYVATSHVYSPQTNPPGSGGVKSLTIGVYADGKLKKLTGAMGTAVMTFTSGKPVSIEWTFTGVWQPPTDVAILAPTYPTAAPLRFVNSGLSVGGFTPRVEELSIDLGNQVSLREDSTQASGYISAVITGRRVTGKLNPEATTVANNDQYGIWLALTTGALNISLGTTGNEVTIAAPVLQVTNVQEGDRNKMEIDEVDFQLCRNSSGGDDEITFTLA